MQAHLIDMDNRPGELARLEVEVRLGQYLQGRGEFFLTVDPRLTVQLLSGVTVQAQSRADRAWAAIGVALGDQQPPHLGGQGAEHEDRIVALLQEAPESRHRLERLALGHGIG